MTIGSFSWRRLVTGREDIFGIAIDEDTVSLFTIHTLFSICVCGMRLFNGMWIVDCVVCV